MTIDVRLFGNLKERAPELDGSGYVGILRIEGDEVETIGDIMRFLDLSEDDVSHLFLNHEYSSPRRPVSDGDGVSIFPRDMALLYKWYFRKAEE